jgi:exodeoxyribonuclease VII small subunit
MPVKNTKSEVDYKQLSEELEIILSDLQTSDLPVDQAYERYERGLDIVQQLESYLKTAELNVKKLKLKTDSVRSNLNED